MPIIDTKATSREAISRPLIQKDHPFEEDKSPEAEENFFMKTEKVEQSVVDMMFKKISIAPGGVSETISGVLLKNFQIINDEKGKPLHVILPKNLEKFADNWLALTAVAAAHVLKITVYPGPELEELSYPKEADQYFHGISSALKASVDGKTSYIQCSGSFQQGFRWAVSHNEIIQANARFFRTDWKHPRDLRIGKTIWGFEKNDDLKRWLNLINRACNKIVLDDVCKFALSFNRIKETLFKTSWTFDKGGVFDETERKEMNSSISKELAAYDAWAASYKDLTIDRMVGYNEAHSAHKALYEYNEQVGLIATLRAVYLYSSKTKKLTSKGAWTLDQRRSLLNPVEWLYATNRTGLLLGSTKLTIQLPKGSNWEDPEVAMVILHNMENRPELDDFTKLWINQTITYMATLVVA